MLLLRNAYYARKFNKSIKSLCASLEHHIWGVKMSIAALAIANLTNFLIDFRITRYVIPTHRLPTNVLE